MHKLGPMAAVMSRRAVIQQAGRMGVATSLLGVFATACSGDDDNPEQGAAAATTPQNEPTAATSSPPFATVAAVPVATTPAASPAVTAPVSSPVAAVTVRMTSQLEFEPQEVTIQAGQTITWLNASPIPHTATDDPAKNPVAATNPDYAQLPDGAEPWDSGLVAEGESWSYTFEVPGEYQYFCIPHILSGMRGTVTVEQGA